MRRQLEVLGAAVSRPGIGDVARDWQPSAAVNTHLTLATKSRFPAAQLEMNRLLAGRDPRLEPPPLGLMDTTGAAVTEWLTPILRDDRLCILLAGDFDPSAALDEVAATFGSLPTRKACSSHWAIEMDPGAVTVPFSAPIPHGTMILGPFGFRRSKSFTLKVTNRSHPACSAHTRCRAS